MSKPINIEADEQKYNRLIHLHHLGIPTPDYFREILKEFETMFESVKVVKAVDINNNNKICCIDKKNNILFTIGNEKNEFKKRYKMFRMSNKYKKIFNDVEKKYPDVGLIGVYTIGTSVLNHNEIFKNMKSDGVDWMISTENDEYFEYLNSKLF